MKVMIRKIKVVITLNERDYVAGISSSQSNVPRKFLISGHLLEVAFAASGEIGKSEIFKSKMFCLQVPSGMIYQSSLSVLGI